MPVLTDVKTALESSFETANPTFSKLAFENDIAKNKYKGTKDQYSFSIKNASEVESVLGSFTMDQSFQGVVTANYSTAKSQTGDALLVSKINDLMQVILTSYSGFVSNRLGVSGIYLISDLNIENPEVLDEEKTLIINYNFVVKYKTST